MSSGFDTADFIAGFIAEAEEHLAATNANLLSVEAAVNKREPTPRQVRDLFRSFHTLKGLAGMVGVDPIVEVAHAMETVLREADRAAGTLPEGSVELLLRGTGVIEQGVRALADKRPVRAAPQALLNALTELRQVGEQRMRSPSETSLPEELWSKLSAAEREQLVRGIEGGRSALQIYFRPSPERAGAGVTITSVRERVAAVAEIVKVIPRAVPASESAPGGLAFALIVLSSVSENTLAEAAAADPGDLTPIQLVATAAAAPLLPDGDIPSDDEKLARHGFVRVEVKRLDDALERLSALVVTQFRLVRTLASLRETGADVRALGQVVSENGRQLRDLRAAIMRARMVSVAELLERVPLIVRGATRATGKAARVEISTGRAELDKAVAERIFPAVVHLIRNAIDHALESPEERRAAGKPEVGLVSVACHERSDNQLELTVSDDGRGVDAAAVARRAATALPTTPEGLLDLLARPGLSTRAEVTQTSGRGMGMDVVKRIAVDELRGELLLDTVPGRGTTFTLRIPLSITIVDAFSFACGGETFVVPVSTVEEIREIDPSKIVRGPDRRRAPRGEPDRRRAPRASDMIERRGQAVPVLQLDDLLGLPSGSAAQRKAIVVRRNGEPFAFAVDRMLGQQEIVVRPLEDALVRVTGVSGTTDLGDGRPTLVLDLAALGDSLYATSTETRS